MSHCVEEFMIRNVGPLKIMISWMSYPEVDLVEYSIVNIDVGQLITYTRVYIPEYFIPFKEHVIRLLCYVEHNCWKSGKKNIEGNNILKLFNMIDYLEDNLGKNKEADDGLLNFIKVLRMDKYFLEMQPYDPFLKKFHKAIIDNDDKEILTFVEEYRISKILR